MKAKFGDDHAYKSDRADFSDWMSFLPSNLMEEITLIQKPLAQIPKVFH